MAAKSILVLFSVVALTTFASAGKVPQIAACPAVDNPNRQAVFLENPWDCSSYYECSNGTPYLMHCPAGLFFDTVQTTCNYETQVNCGSRRKTIDVDPKLPEISLYDVADTE